jgi:hypothetical protein
MFISSLTFVDNLWSFRVEENLCRVFNQEGDGLDRINLLNSVTFLFLFQAMELVRFIDICGIVDHQCLSFLFKGLHMKKYPSLVISYKIQQK